MPIAVELRGYKRVEVESISKPIVTWIGERKSFFFFFFFAGLGHEILKVEG